jgi:hypothetical protein
MSYSNKSEIAIQWSPFFDDSFILVDSSVLFYRILNYDGSCMILISYTMNPSKLDLFFFFSKKLKTVTTQTSIYPITPTQVCSPQSTASSSQKFDSIVLPRNPKFSYLINSKRLKKDCLLVPELGLRELLLHPRVARVLRESNTNRPSPRRRARAEYDF